MDSQDHDREDEPPSRADASLWRLISDRMRRPKASAADSVILGIGYLAETLLRIAYFFILVQVLGPETFGRFAAALAAINLISPLAGLGFGEVALVRVSANREESGKWTLHAVVTTIVLGLLVTVGLSGISAFLPNDRWLIWYEILGLAFCELVLVRTCHVVARIHQARRETVRVSVINTVVAAAKCMAACSLVVVGTRSVGLLVCCLDAMVVMVAAFFLVRCFRLVGTSTLSLTLLRESLGLAGSFAAGVVSKAVYTDLDKLFLAKWSTPLVVGTYAAGYKIISLAFMPMRAILEATFPRQVELAKHDPVQCNRFTFSVMMVNVGLGFCIAMFLFIAAPFIVALLGEDYTDSVGVLRWGFLLPVIQAVHYTLGNHLTAIGHQRARMMMQVVLLCIYVLAGIIFIPLYSWRGAIATSLGCECLLGIMFLVASQTLPNRFAEAIDSTES